MARPPFCFILRLLTPRRSFPAMRCEQEKWRKIVKIGRKQEKKRGGGKKKESKKERRKKEKERREKRRKKEKKPEIAGRVGTADKMTISWELDGWLAVELSDRMLRCHKEMQSHVND